MCPPIRDRANSFAATFCGLRKCHSLQAMNCRRYAAGENTDDLQPVNPRLWVACGRCERKPLQGYGTSFHQARIMLWINASATSGECPRIVAHTSFGNSLVILPTSP